MRERGIYRISRRKGFKTTRAIEMPGRRFKAQHEASLALFDFIERWYSPRRRHSALGYVSPNALERRMAQAA